jgi:hypothetical protein
MAAPRWFTSDQRFEMGTLMIGLFVCSIYFSLGDISKVDGTSVPCVYSLANGASASEGYRSLDFSNGPQADCRSRAS